MIRSFRDSRTARFAAGDRIREFLGFERQAHRRLRILNDADSIKDLMLLPSNRFEALSGDRKGQYTTAGDFALDFEMEML